MPRLWIQISLFLSSYLPLFVLVGIRSVSESETIWRLCAVLAGASIIGTAVFIYMAYARSEIDVVVLDVEDRDPDVAAYLATYLLPFVTVFTGRWQDVVSLFGFIFVLGVVYVRSRLIYINPTLALLGFHVARIISATPGTEEQDRVRWPRYVLARKRPLVAGEQLRAHEVTPDLLILTASEDVNRSSTGRRTS
jgi:hypothetical protein